MHSSSLMQLLQLCVLSQTPLAQPSPLGLQPSTQVLSSVQYEPVGHASSLGRQSTQVPSSRQKPLSQAGHCGPSPPAPAPPETALPAVPPLPPLELVPPLLLLPPLELVPPLPPLPPFALLPPFEVALPAPPSPPSVELSVPPLPFELLGASSPQA